MLAAATLLCIGLLAPLASASSGVHPQHPFKRHDDASSNLPHVSFASAPDAPPVLVKSEYNQFAPPPTHHSNGDKHKKNHHHDKDDEISRGTFVRWMQQLGLHASQHQVDKLYGLVSRHKHHKHHHEQHANGEKKVSGAAKPAWVQVSPPPPGGSREKGNGGDKEKMEAVSSGVGGVGKARSWGEEGGPSPPTKNSSPVSAAQPPLPEPANSFLPSATPASSSTGSEKGKKVLPLPAVGAHHNSSSIAPVTSLPSSAPSSLTHNNASDTSGTSGSLNPSSTPPPPPAPAAATEDGANNVKPNVGDTRLTPLTNGTTQGNSIAGVPIADDGDLKIPHPPLVNSTAGKLGDSGAGRNKSGGQSAVQLDAWSWAGGVTVAAVVLGVLLFAL